MSRRPGEASWLQVVRRLPAWAGIVLAAAVTLAIALTPPDPSIRPLHGAWDAAVSHSDGTVERRQVLLPGLFVHQGLSGDARVLLSRELTVGSEPLALLVDTPQYAMIVSWDGRPIGGVGDPSATGRDARTTRSLFVALPVEPPGTRHRLSIDLKGDYGKGGITGRVVVGPVSAVHEAGWSAEVQRQALALGLCLLGALPLIVAARGPFRPAYAAFGLFATSLAALALGQANLVYDLLPDALASIRLRRFFDPLIGPLGFLYADTYLRGRASPASQALIGAGLALGVFGLVAPPGWLYRLEVVQDGLLVIGTLGFVAVSLRGARDRVPGAALLAAAILPVVWGLVSELLLSHGLRTGGSHVLAAGLLFTIALGAALVVRDAEVSEQHDRLVRGSLDAMVTVDAGGRIRDANPAAARLLAPIGPEYPVLLAVEEADRPLVNAHLARAVQRADRTEFRTTRGRVLESLATPLGPGMLMLTLRDITVRRELDRGLLQAARIETVGVLLGGIAHDFNNMLSSLLAHMGLLRVQTNDARVRDRLDRMEGTVDRAAELTKRLLTIARGTGSELGVTDLRAVCRGAAELVEPTLPSGVVLSFEVPEDLPPVLGAAGDLEQVLVNLLVNARDAVGDEGRVRMAARPFRVGDEGRGVAVLIEDDGPGIPGARKDEIFQPFVTTKPRGTGLGLAVARQILRDHHGRIWVEDRPGGGARFLVALRHADAVDEAPAPLPRGRRVVVVEDEQVLLEDYVSGLQAAGYEVHGFETGTRAAEWLEQHEPDLLVTDVVMPGMNGVELARLSRELHPSTPILFVSAFVPEESLHGLPSGAWDALHKPIRAARLVATVGRIRRRHERRLAGDDEITWVSYLFPDLDGLSADALGFDDDEELPSGPVRALLP